MVPANSNTITKVIITTTITPSKMRNSKPFDSPDMPIIDEVLQTVGLMGQPQTQPVFFDEHEVRSITMPLEWSIDSEDDGQYRLRVDVDFELIRPLDRDYKAVIMEAVRRRLLAKSWRFKSQDGDSEFQLELLPNSDSIFWNQLVAAIAVDGDDDDEGEDADIIATSDSDSDFDQEFDYSFICICFLVKRL